MAASGLHFPTISREQHHLPDDQIGFYAVEVKLFSWDLANGIWDHFLLGLATLRKNLPYMKDHHLMI